MANGCAVVAPGHAPAREVLRDGVSGCLVEAANSAALGDAAIGLLGDAATAERYGREPADVAGVVVASTTLSLLTLPLILVWLL